MQPTHNLIVSILKIGKLINEEFIWFFGLESKQTETKN